MKENKEKFTSSKNTKQKIDQKKGEGFVKITKSETKLYKNFTRNALDGDDWCLSKL